jgi:N-acetyl-beta-hexosaminidase
MSAYGFLSRREQGQKFSAYRLTDLFVAQVPKTLSKQGLNVCAWDKVFS